MKLIAFALLFAATAAHAGTYPYQAAFNQYGYSLTQTATMTGNDMAVAWFLVPSINNSGNYLIQVSNGSDSAGIQHRAVITDENGAVVATQQGYYPSFYVTAGQTGLLQSNEMYLIYIYNVGPGGAPSCAQGRTCNVTILIQPAN